MSQFFDDLEAQLHEAARAQTTDHPSDSAQTPPHQSRLRSWGRAVPVALAVAVTAAVVAVALTVHSSHASRAPAKSAAARGSRPKVVPPVGGGITVPAGATVGGMQVLGTLGHLSAQQQHELSKYVSTAQFKASKSSVCQPPSVKPTVSDGSPSPGLLSVLGVLRRPATRSDQPRVPHVSAPLYPAGVQGVYVRYVRRAQVKAGISYYLIPAARLDADPMFVAPCRAKQVAVLRSELRRVPAGERASTLALQARWLALFARAGQQGEGVCLMRFAVARAGGGGGGACNTASEAERGDLTESTGSTYSGVVPDGVATVTVHYPARNGVAATTLTSGVVGNVFAIRIPGLTLGGGPPPTVTWRSATGQVIKTISTR
jgi:hypothetical protein